MTSMTSSQPTQPTTPTMESNAAVTAADWLKGIAFSVLASVIGGASKLAIRKSWLMIERLQDVDGPDHSNNNNANNIASAPSGELSRDQHRRSSERLDTFDHHQPSSHVAVAPMQQPQSSDNDMRGSPPGIELPERQLPPGSAAATAGQETPGLMCSMPSQLSLPSIPSTATSFLDEGSPQTDPLRAKKIRRRSHFLRFCGMIGMTVLNPLCCVLAMNYASPSILAPFSGLTLVWIVLFSESLIGERPAYVQVMAAALIIVGETIVAIFGDHTNDGGRSLNDVRNSYLDPNFVIYLCCMMMWVGFLGYLMTKSKSKTLRRFAWGVSGGSITGLQNFLKDSLTVIKAVAPGGPNAGMSYPWFFYLLAFLAAMTAFVGLLFLVACMKRYDATFSSAMFVGSFVVSASIMAAVHYSTFQNLVGVWNFIMYPFGLLVLMVGVDILVRNTSSSMDDVLECSNHNIIDGYSGQVLDCDGDNEGAAQRRDMQEPLVSPSPSIQGGELT